MAHYLVVCTENRLDEVLLIEKSDDLKEAVKNGLTVYRKFYAKSGRTPKGMIESYHADLNAYVHDPVGYNDRTFALMGIDTTGEAKILDLEAILEDKDFWNTL